MTPTRARAAVHYIHYLLQFVCRYYIAIVILGYALAKILQTQFYVPPSHYDAALKDLSGISLTWAFFGYSYGYGVFLAGAQILSSLLLLFRRTVRLGVLLFLPIIGNIVLIDYFYDISALSIALNLLLAATYLFLADIRAFLAYAVGKPYIGSSSGRSVGWEKCERRLSWAKYVLIPLIFVYYCQQLYTARQQYMPMTPLVGIWAFPLSEARWSRLYIDSGKSAFIRLRGGIGDYGEDLEDPLLRDQCTIDTTTRKISISPASRPEDGSTTVAPPSPLDFHIEGTYELSSDGTTLTIRPQVGKALILKNIPAHHRIDYVIP